MSQGKISRSVGNSSEDCQYKFIVEWCTWRWSFLKIRHQVRCSYSDVLDYLQIPIIYNTFKSGLGDEIKVNMEFFFFNLHVSQITNISAAIHYYLEYGPIPLQIHLVLILTKLLLW